MEQGGHGKTPVLVHDRMKPAVWAHEAKAGEIAGRLQHFLLLF